MAVESKPLFHPEVMRQQVRSFILHEHVAASQPKPRHWVRADDEWEPYLHENRNDNARLTRTLGAAEAELNDRVYLLFNLTAAEVKLLKKEVQH